jgi:OOP family OmpA-OmpF porin
VSYRRSLSLCSALGALAVTIAVPGRADAQSAGRLAVHGEGALGSVIFGNNADRFGLGGSVAGRLGLRLVGPLSVQLNVGGAWLPAQGQEPVGQLFYVGGGLRLHGRVSSGVLGGPVLDANGALGVTGGLLRPVFDVGVGWEFYAGELLGFGPIVRYQHVLQTDDTSPGDAPMLFGGLAVTIRIPSFARSTPTNDREPANETPSVDSDGDGVPDAQDRCPLEPEDHDGFQDEDGCPDPDNDNDGILDTQDRCPNAAEVRNGFEDEDGCPDVAPTPPPPPSSSEPAWRPLEPTVTFQNGSARITSSQRATLDALCAQFRGSSQRVRVAGHADERGTPEFNQDLSARRAGAVTAYLVGCGVAAERVESAGYGATRPVCTDSSEECRARNRRVEFQVEAR